jgi:hypothetical protein
MKTLLTPNDLPQKDRTELCIKANMSNTKAKTELFPMDSVLELNTKNLGNSPSFLTITHMTLFAKWFGSFNVQLHDWILLLGRTVTD